MSNWLPSHVPSLVALTLLGASGQARAQVVVRAFDTPALVGSAPALTFVTVSDAFGLNGAVFGMKYDGRVARISIERPPELAPSCDWQGKVGAGSFCVAVACPQAIASTHVAHNLAMLKVAGCRAGSTQVQVGYGACPEDSCAVSGELIGDAACAGAPGTLTVSTPAEVPCSGDCNGDTLVTIGEVQRCVVAFLGADFCAYGTATYCTAADANRDGAVTLTEVTKCVRRFLGNC